MSNTKYFLYARKSTEEDDRQVMSIESQLFELREFARKENLEILEEFQESKSAKTPGRPIFEKMIEKVNDSHESIGILSWNPDRLARNAVDGGKIIHLIDQKKIVSLRFPTFWFEPTPQGLFMLQVAFGQSKYFSDNLVQNVKRGIRQKLRRGEWLNLAPFGYVNNARTRNIEPHPTNSRIVVKALEEYAKGTHTYVSLAQFWADLGAVTRNGTPLPKISIRKILTGRAYLGFIKHHEEYFEGNFEPIVSVKLFEAVQKVLRTKERPRKTRKDYDFPFLGIFKCGECDGMFTAQYAKQKQYRYYRCTKKKGKCSQAYLSESVLVSQLKERLQSISLCDKYTDHMLGEIDKWEKKETEVSQSDVQNLAVKIKESEARMEKLVGAYLDNDIPKDIYLKQKDTAMRAALTLKDKKKDLEHNGNNWGLRLRLSSLRDAVFCLFLCLARLRRAVLVC
ncbi:MAG: hypothetical protein B7X04_04260 [Parcubacteria group bacterium 21-54-25]|nr:MAG: hypothetical protein B7X04_04260 [Parcubacteria group bacterium 21-54-25]